MKTYDEMKDSVFRRMDEYEAEKKRRRKIYKRTAAAACPLCAAGAAVFALWGGRALGKEYGTQGGQQFNSVAEAGTFAVTYADDLTEEKRIVATTAVSGTDSPAAETTEQPSGATEDEVQLSTEDTVYSGADVPDEGNDKEEKPTDAPRITTAAGTAAAERTSSATTTTAAAPPANLWCIFVSSISYNGVAYHDSDIIWSPYFTQDRYIGKVRDFAGTYGENVNYRINPDDSVYTVRESSELLLVVKADSSSVYGSVIPMCSQNFQYDSYEHGSLVPNLTYTENADGSPAAYNGFAQFNF